MKSENLDTILMNDHQEFKDDDDDDVADDNYE